MALFIIKRRQFGEARSLVNTHGNLYVCMLIILTPSRTSITDKSDNITLLFDYTYKRLSVKVLSNGSYPSLLFVRNARLLWNTCVRIVPHSLYQPCYSKCGRHLSSTTRWLIYLPFGLVQMKCSQAWWTFLQGWLHWWWLGQWLSSGKLSWRIPRLSSFSCLLGIL